MPMTTYLNNEQIAGLLVKSNKLINFDPYTVADYFLSLVEKGEHPVSKLYYAPSAILDNKISSRLYNEIMDAKKAKNSIRAQQFLARLTKILKYAKGDKKYGDVLKTIESKNIRLELKKMHLYRSEPVDRARWMLSDECAYGDFFAMFHKTIPLMSPEQIFMVFADENGEYTTVINKLTKFLKTKNEAYFKEKGFTASDVKEYERNLSRLINMLKKPDEESQKLALAFKKANMKPAENKRVKRKNQEIRKR